jgi:aminobenzoyl-glutamate utilization protein B
MRFRSLRVNAFAAALVWLVSIFIVGAPAVAAVEDDPLVIKVNPAKLTPLKKEAIARVDADAAELHKLSDTIWTASEVAMEEYKSAEALAVYLERNGFKVERGVAGLSTAFVGVFGSGEPVIGFLAEYDALPGLSQQAASVQKPVREGAPGHGCGHNLFGTASAGAAVAVKDVMSRHGIKGTLKVFGCPAEETVEGKVFMARAGVFDGLSCCLQWHPGADNQVPLGSSSALNQFEVEFFGKTAHAAGDPWHGRSALDAVELADVGLNFLREHLQPTARIHYVIIDGGGAPNVVPDHARAWYYVRDIDREILEADYERVLKVFDGAALMTGTSYKIHFQSGVHEMLANRTGDEVVYANLLAVGAPVFTEEEQAFAKEIQKNSGVEEKGLSAKIEPFKLPERSWGDASTDVAEVSWLTPTTSLVVAAAPLGVPGHHWSTAACSGLSIGRRGLLTGAKVLSASCLDFLTQPQTVQKMREEWKADRHGREYKSPLPADLGPRVVPRKESAAR